MVSRPVGWALVLGASAVSLAWLWRGTGVVATSAITVAAPVAVASAPALQATLRIEPAVPAAAAAVAPPVPYTYVGSWHDGRRLHLSLKRGDVIQTVTGLAAVDERYVVVAADEDRVSLRYLPLGTVQVIRREAPVRAAPPTTRMPSARNNDDTEAQTEN